MPLIVKLLFHHHHLARAWPIIAPRFYFYVLPALSRGHSSLPFSLLDCHSCCQQPRKQSLESKVGFMLTSYEALTEK